MEVRIRIGYFLVHFSNRPSLTDQCVELITNSCFAKPVDSLRHISFLIEQTGSTTNNRNINLIEGPQCHTRALWSDHFDGAISLLAVETFCSISTSSQKSSLPQAFYYASKSRGLRLIVFTTYIVLKIKREDESLNFRLFLVYTDKESVLLLPHPLSCF